MDTYTKSMRIVQILCFFNGRHSSNAFLTVRNTAHSLFFRWSFLRIKTASFRSHPIERAFMFLVQRPFRDFNSFRVRIFISHMYITHTHTAINFPELQLQSWQSILDLSCCSIPGRVGRREIGSAHAARGTPRLGVSTSRYWLYTRGISVDEKEAVHARWVQGVHIEQFAGLVRFATH